MTDTTTKTSSKPAFTMAQLIAFANSNQERIDNYEAELEAKAQRYRERGSHRNREYYVSVCGR